MKNKKSLLLKAESLLIAGICAVSSFGLTGFGSYADVIYEPQNSFYTSHMRECGKIDEGYIANSPDDDGLKLYESPVSSVVDYTVDNGERIYGSATYKDSAGNTWVFISGYEAWAPLDYLVPVYNEADFRNEHGSEIVKESGVMARVKADGEGDEYMLYYDYPGSEDHFFDYGEDDITYVEKYVDPFGYTWYYSDSDYVGWYCADNPRYFTEQLYPDGQNFSGVKEITKPTMRVTPGASGINVPLVVGICVCAIVAITAVIIAVVLNGNKKKKNGQE